MALFRVSLPALLVGLTFSHAALPIGFGELQVQSRLNQPLQAEIPVLGVTPSAVGAVKVRLGGRDEFAAMGFDYPREIDALAADLVVRDDQVVLQLRGRDALREPLLNLVLVAEEGSTRMLRDYAVLLDLPETESRATAPVAVVRSQPERLSETNSPTQTTASPIVAAAPVVSAEASTQAITTVTASPAADMLSSLDALRYGPTRAGDSLSIIAHRLGKARGDEWHAFGVALYLANPEAFIAGDPNRLKAAMSLQLPTPDTVNRYSRRDWNALFAGTLTATSVPETTTAAQTSAPTQAAQPSAPVPNTQSLQAANLPTPRPQAPIPQAPETPALADLRRENAQLRTELSATAARMQELEQRLAELDARQQGLVAAAATAPATNLAAVTPEVAVSIADASAVPTSTDADRTGSSENTVVAAPLPTVPVAVEIRNQVADTTPSAASSANNEAFTATEMPPASEAKALSGETSIGSIWSTVLLPLLLLFGLTATGALFWFWYERHQRSQRRKPVTRAVREPRPVLPLVHAEERNFDVSTPGSPERRALKMKQIQAALDTYVSYQRLDRAIELLEQESLHAGDDLVLRRHLQKILKDIRRQHQQWQEKQQLHLAAQFDQATTTQINRSSTRDDGMKSSG